MLRTSNPARYTPFNAKQSTALVCLSCPACGISLQKMSLNWKVSTFPMPNMISTPLVVIMPLTQYSKALRGTWPRLKDEDSLPAEFMQESVAAGLCTGMLGATAASHSVTLQSLAMNRGKAVRQTMAIRAMVDAEIAAGGSDGRAVSSSVSCGTGRTLGSVKKLI